VQQLPGFRRHYHLPGCCTAGYESKGCTFAARCAGVPAQRRSKAQAALEQESSSELRAAGTQRMAAISAPARPTALPPLGSIKGVLFDIDGTLCDSDPLHYRAFREILLEKGYKARARPATVRRSWRLRWRP